MMTSSHSGVTYSEMTARIVQTCPGDAATAVGEAIERATTSPMFVRIVAAVGIVAHLTQ